MHGNVIPPGRPEPPHPSWNIPLDVRFFDPDTGDMAHLCETATDEWGAFTCENVPEGTHDISAKGSNTLSERLSGFALTASNNTASFGELPGGDANNDDVVALADLSILASFYGTAGEDGRPDFNGDESVDLKDLSILASNYGQEGADAQACASATRVSRAARTLADDIAHEPTGGSVSIMAESKIVREGDSFWVTIRVAAGGQEVDAAEADVRVDPAYLTILGVSGAGPLDFEPPGNSFNPAAGTVRWARAKLGSPFPTGTFELCRIQLRAVRTTAQTKVDLVSPSDALRNGRSVLGSLSDGAIAIGPAPTATPTGSPTPTPPPTATPTATPSLGALQAIAFVDLNGNGQRDYGEPFVAGAVLTVTNSANAQMGRFVAGAAGIPTGMDLPPGVYGVTVQVPPIYAVSEPVRHVPVAANQWTRVEFAAVLAPPTVLGSQTGDGSWATLGAVDMLVSPATANAYTGQTFRLTVMLSAGSQEVDTAEAYIQVDPAYLQLVSVQPVGPLNYPAPGNYVNASAGRLKYGAVKLGAPFPTGSFPLCTIDIRAVTPTGSAKAIQFVSGSEIMRTGVSILGRLVNGQVNVTNPPPTNTPAPTHTPTVTPTPTPALGGIWAALYNDMDADGERDSGETDLHEGRILLSRAGSALGELSPATPGRWGWAELLAGVYLTEAEAPEGYAVTTPPKEVEVVAGQWAGVQFGLAPSDEPTLTPTPTATPEPTPTATPEPTPTPTPTATPVTGRIYKVWLCITLYPGR